MGFLFFFAVGGALGWGVSLLARHPRRCLGLVPLGTTGMVGIMVWLMAELSPDSPLPTIPCSLLGFTGMLIFASLSNAWPGIATLTSTLVYAATETLFIGIVAWIMVVRLFPPATTNTLLVATAVAAAVTWALLWRQLLELVLEGVIWPFHRIQAHGPGRNGIPKTGPLLIVSNHTAYADPFWIAKVMPRRTTPMMLSVFYDKPALRWLMRHVVGAIRVEKSGFRREAPELREAVAALDRGEAVLLFPEGILRRKEEMVLRLFGRGVWHILRERPLTPVVLCWIEGGWGSYASYKDGPPFVNKRLDWGRPIDVAIAEPIVLPAEVLADHRQTREYLWHACLACRRYLGLDVPAERPGDEDGQEVDRLESRL
jgi:1-acyl-sn-glycerol-3-phosphate acyltransferase